ncbi:MAG: response regulator transcription factor [Xanthomonadales bacterium]|jgi:DNA-binding NarL/FixJ family response regulator|nr:response regulator transcription factor [Xanthomonadales bacterium]
MASVTAVPAHALILDDLPACLDWLRRALEQAFPGITIRTATTLAEARARIAEAAPLDLALVDLGLPDGDGTTLIARLRQQRPAVIPVVTTVFDDDAHLFPALSAGAAGYLLKDEAVDALAQRLLGIVEGQPPLSPSIARRLLRHFQPLPSAPVDSVSLTPRETEVLRLIAKGYSVPEAAQLLGLAKHTVAGYVKDIYRKLDVGNRAEATLEASRRGLIRAD